MARKKIEKINKVFIDQLKENTIDRINNVINHFDLANRYEASTGMLFKYTDLQVSLKNAITTRIAVGYNDYFDLNTHQFMLDHQQFKIYDNLSKDIILTEEIQNAISVLNKIAEHQPDLIQFRYIKKARYGWTNPISLSNLRGATTIEIEKSVASNDVVLGKCTREITLSLSEPVALLRTLNLKKSRRNEDYHTVDLFFRSIWQSKCSQAEASEQANQLVLVTQLLLDQISDYFINGVELRVLTEMGIEYIPVELVTTEKSVRKVSIDFDDEEEQEIVPAVKAIKTHRFMSKEDTEEESNQPIISAEASDICDALFD